MKDSVFTLLFGEPAHALELYNALSGANYPADTPVEMVTIKNAFIQNRVNDVAFLLGDKLIVLVEHQSTDNENIPLRFLMYASAEYQRITANTPRALYSKQLLPIRKPEFVVLYNGKAPHPAKKVLRLSDAFMKPDMGSEIESCLELTATVLNIHSPENARLLSRSGYLGGYAWLFQRIEHWKSQGYVGIDAIMKAVEDCKREGILVDFMRRYGSEVINMLFYEFDLDECIRVNREEGGRKILIKNVKGMLAEGFPVEGIARACDLSVEDVERIKEDAYYPSTSQMV
jgi:hypothetical protein